MPGYRKTNDGYEWELNLPPASVATLLSAVCVDVTPGRPNPHWLGHLLWGPKSWQLRFEGSNFRLEPLHREEPNRLWGFPHGKIVATDSGSRVLIWPEYDRWGVKRHMWVLSLVLAPAFLAFFFISVTTELAFWVRSLVVLGGVLGLTAWFAFACLWLIPWMARMAYLDFLDELFEKYLVADSKPRKM